MIVLMCGDRNWTNEKIIEEYIKILPSTAVIIHGGCRGADKISGRLGRKHNHVVIVYEAEWEMFGRGAGPRRNEEMLMDGKPNIVVAFHDNIEQSKGTKDVVMRAIKKGIDVQLKNSKGETFIFDERHKEWVNITPSKRMQKCLDDGMFVSLNEESDNRSL